MSPSGESTSSLSPGKARPRLLLAKAARCAWFPALHALSACAAGILSAQEPAPPEAKPPAIPVPPPAADVPPADVPTSPAVPAKPAQLDGGQPPGVPASPAAPSPDAKAGDLPKQPGSTAEPSKPGTGALPDAGLFIPNLDEGIPARSRGGVRMSRDTVQWPEPALPRQYERGGVKFARSPLDVALRDESAGEEPVQDAVPERQPFISPSFYGRAPNVLFPGQGRLRWPLSWRAGVSLENGYDDNSFQIPDGVNSALNQAGSSSIYSSVGLAFSVERASSFSVFTFDVLASASYFWDRETDRELFNIPSLRMLYVQRLHKHTQFTANVSLAYLSQADFSNAANVFASQNLGGGDYLTLQAKADISHQWAKYFSTITSVSANLLYFPEGSARLSALAVANGVTDPAAIAATPAAGVAGVNGFSGDVLDLTFGNEFRFSTSRHLSWIVEGRYGLQESFDNTALNSTTAYFLAGLDWIWERRVSSAIRAGVTVRDSNAFGTSTNPYVELATSIALGKYSSLGINGRYGLELTNVNGNGAPSYRFGLAYSHILGRRLSMNASVNYLNTANAFVGPGVPSGTQTWDIILGLAYQIGKNLSLGAQAAYTRSDSDINLQSFDRTRGSVTMQYNF